MAQRTINSKVSTVIRIRKWLKPLEHTPFHPQWLALNRRNTLKWAAKNCSGTVLDVGCGDATLQVHVREKCKYLGLDHPATRSLGYEGKNNLYGDASWLPIKDRSIDTLVMLDVLEHLVNPRKAVAEAFRVLKPGGIVIFQTPFMYPMHDEPHDYHRWTAHGLRALFECAGFRITDGPSPGVGSIQSATALSCIALTQSSIDAAKQYSPAILMIPLYTLLVPVINVTGWILGTLFPKTGFMSLSYRGLARRSLQCTECQSASGCHEH